MKKRLFRLLTITIVLSSLFLAFRVPVRADDDTLEATEIHVEVTVSEDNIFTITENITINFLTPHHGIIRNIPLSNWITRQDGSTSYNSATVTNVECNEPYTTGYSGGDYSIRIGDADKTVTGIKKYVLAEDKMEGFKQAMIPSRGPMSSISTSSVPVGTMTFII